MDVDSELSKKVDEIIKNIYDNHPEEDVNEIEFSIIGLGQKDPKNPWNIGISKFRQMLTGLSNLTSIQPKYELMLTANVGNDRVRINDIREIQKFCVNNTPAIDAQNIIFETKSRAREPIDLPEYGLRLRYANESPINNMQKREDIVKSLSDNKVQKYYRHAQRYSIISNREFGESGKGKLSVDFTSVRQGPGRDFRAAQLTGPGALTQDRYEIEIELSNIKKSDFNNEYATKIKEELKLYLTFLLVSLYGGAYFSNYTDLLSGLNGYLKLSDKLINKKDISPMVVNDLHQNTLIRAVDRFITVNIKTLNMDHIVGKHATLVIVDDLKKDEVSAPAPPSTSDPSTSATPSTSDPSTSATPSTPSTSATPSTPSTSATPSTPVPEAYAFTDKADGIRSLMYINSEGVAYVLTRNTIKRTTYIEGKETQELGNSPILDIYPTGLKYSSDSSIKNNNCLLDGEYLKIGNKMYFLIFDILIDNDKNVTQEDFQDRIGRFNNNRFNIPDGPGLHVKNKEFFNYTITTFKAIVENTDRLKIDRDIKHQIIGLNYISQGLEYKLDGLIFQPLKGPNSFFPLDKGTWDKVFKWKPSFMSTVDMILTYDAPVGPPPKFTKEVENTTLDSVRSDNKTYGIFNAIVNRKKERVAYVNGRTVSEYKCYAPMLDNVPRTEDENGLGEPIRKGAIVECRLSIGDVGTGGMHWVPIRIRHDKSKPNDIVVYDDLINTIIHKPITLEILSEKNGGLGGSKDIKVNKINRDVSNEYIVSKIKERQSKSEIKILDIGCGNIKSATVWEILAKTNTVEVLGVDTCDTVRPNINLQEYMKRKGIKLKAEIVHGNFNKDFLEQQSISAYLAKPNIFNVATCTFAIHYSMGTEAIFRTFVHNVSRNLSKDGIFIGSYMNKNKIVEDIKKSKKTTIGHSKVWEIELISPKTSDTSDFNSTFGVGINVSFIDLYTKHQEFLIDLEDPTVTKILKEKGLELIDHTPFISTIDDAKLKSMTIGEQQWFGYHYAFLMKKTAEYPQLPTMSKPDEELPAPEVYGAATNEDLVSEPTVAPKGKPTTAPTVVPTKESTKEPAKPATTAPTVKPTAPTKEPTKETTKEPAKPETPPVKPETPAPTATTAPTVKPTAPTKEPETPPGKPKLPRPKVTKAAEAAPKGAEAVPKGAEAVPAAPKDKEVPAPPTVPAPMVKLTRKPKIIIPGVSKQRDSPISENIIENVPEELTNEPVIATIKTLVRMKLKK